jgi:hypothetical protein
MYNPTRAKRKRFPDCILNDTYENSRVFFEVTDISLDEEGECTTDLDTEEYSGHEFGTSESSDGNNSEGEKPVKRSDIYKLLSTEKRKSSSDEEISQGATKRGRKKSNIEKWENRFDELCVFKEKHGHFGVTDYGLRKWIGWQRFNNKKGKLTVERTEKLNKIGFPWVCREKWEDRFRELCYFKAIHGHTNVPRKDHPQLGSWVQTQRQKRKNCSISQERMDKLNSIEFCWGVRQIKYF